MDDINAWLRKNLDKAFEDASKDHKERIEPFIEKARQSIKHPHFQYAEVDTDEMTIEYKRKKWLDWFSGKRIVYVKIKPFASAGLPKYAKKEERQ